MGQNFLDCDREQAFLLPPSLRDWLPEDHLAWFHAAYRADGHGRAAYEPSVMVAVILYAYSTNERSSRGIERRCRQDVAYRVITGNQTPGHATIARFIRRHQQALTERGQVHPVDRVDHYGRAGPADGSRSCEPCSTPNSA